jgi:hypothetical protein
MSFRVRVLCLLWAAQQCLLWALQQSSESISTVGVCVSSFESISLVGGQVGTSVDFGSSVGLSVGFGVLRMNESKVIECQTT